MSILSILKKLKYKILQPEISYGTIMEKRPTDWQVSSDLVPIIPLARHQFDEFAFQYNQPDVDANSCSCFGSGGCLSSLVGKKFDISDFKYIWDQEVSKGNASPAWGGYASRMFSAWKNWWNEKHPEDPVEFWAVDVGSALFWELYDKGYRIGMGYTNHENYNRDWLWDNLVNKDWQLGDGEDWGVQQPSGHLLGFTKSIACNVKGFPTVNVDNYFNTISRKSNNIYGVNRIYIKELVERGIWHSMCYVFLFTNDIPKETEKVVDKKLMLRLENRVIYNKEKDQFAIIKDGKAEVLPGKNISELFKYKWENKDESYCLGVDKNNWEKLGLN